MDPKALFSDKELEKALSDAAFYHFSMSTNVLNEPESTLMTSQETDREDTHRQALRHEKHGQREISLDTMASDLSVG